jgi:hypothetical protein
VPRALGRQILACITEGKLFFIIVIGFTIAGLAIGNRTEKSSSGAASRKRLEHITAKA